MTYTRGGQIWTLITPETCSLLHAILHAIGQTVFINTQMDDVIYGWDKMSGKDIKGEKIWFQPQDSRFFEYQSTGAGAEKNDGRRQLTAEQAAEYSKEKVLAGWTPTAP